MAAHRWVSQALGHDLGAQNPLKNPVGKEPTSLATKGLAQAIVFCTLLALGLLYHQLISPPPSQSADTGTSVASSPDYNENADSSNGGQDETTGKYKTI